jgi:hypothetical protein
MDMKISSPEILFLCSCALFINSQFFIASIFLTLGVIGASIRLAVDSYNRKEDISYKKDKINIAMSVVNSFFSSLSIIASNLSNQENLDRNIDEEDYN